jgi:hypothetical protein
MTIAAGKAKSVGRPAEDVQRLARTVLYFLGKLKGRHPDLKPSEVFTMDLLTPLVLKLGEEFRRCDAESTVVGLELLAQEESLSAAIK